MSDERWQERARLWEEGARYDGAAKTQTRAPAPPRLHPPAEPLPDETPAVAPPRWVKGTLHKWRAPKKPVAGGKLVPQLTGNIRLTDGRTLNSVERCPAQPPLWTAEQEAEGFKGVLSELKDDTPCRVLLSPAGELLELRWGLAAKAEPPAPVLAGQEQAPPLRIPLALQAPAVQPDAHLAADAFHNPYSFVGAVKRNDFDPTWGRKEPPAHDRYHTGHLSGELLLQLTAETPYFSAQPRPGRQEGDQVFEPRTDIPATTLKGALRSVYEAMTNSCFGVFDALDRRVSYRLDPGASRDEDGGLLPRDLRPVRLVLDEQGLAAEWMQEVRLLAYDGAEAEGPRRPYFPHKYLGNVLEGLENDAAVWFRRAELGMVAVTAKENVEKIRDEDQADRVEAFFLQPPTEQERAKCFPKPVRIVEGTVERLKRSEHIDGMELPVGTKGVRVRAGSGTGQTFFPFRRDSQGKIRPTKARGVKEGTRVWCATTPRSYLLDLKPSRPGAQPPAGYQLGFLRKDGKTIRWKVFESVFFSYSVPRLKELPASIARDFEQLIEDTQRVNQGAQQQCVRSPFLDDPTRRRLREGMLLYASLDRGDEGEIHKLFRVKIGRALHETTFREALARVLEPSEEADPETDGPYNRPGSLLPCRHGRLLCPACRLFGWVGQRGTRHRDLDGRAIPTAHKGRIRFFPAQLQGSPLDSLVNFKGRPYGGGRGLPLAVLSSPKANRAAFYLRQVSGKTPRWNNTGSCLSGRKFYWNPRRRRDEWPTGAQVSPLRNPFRRENDTVDTQNRIITGWIKPGAVFTTRLHFENLAPAELGALLACLELPAGCALRIGGGKPFGFGCFSSRVRDLRLLDAQASYRELGPLSLHRPGEGELRAWLEEFVRTLHGAYRDQAEGNGEEPDLARLPFVADLLRILAGPSPEAPIHYPRVTGDVPNPGPQIEWCKNNRNRELPRPRSNSTLKKGI